MSPTQIIHEIAFIQKENFTHPGVVHLLSLSFFMEHVYDTNVVLDGAYDYRESRTAIAGELVIFSGTNSFLRRNLVVLFKPRTQIVDSPWKTI